MSPLTRILIRYVAGYLVLSNLLPEDLGDLIANDPDVAMLVELAAGAVCALAVETWYVIARRLGWTK